MSGGYLVIETNAAYPGLVRMRYGQSAPAVPAPESDSGPVARYTARFDDLDAARMHTHNALRRRLVDVESGLYRSEAIDAVAAVESTGLSHKRIYIDPRLSQSRELAAKIAQRNRRRFIVDRIWQAVGTAAILLLLLKLLLGI